MENARELAAKLNAQLELGVAQAEAKKVQADAYYKSIIEKRNKQSAAPKKSRIKWGEAVHSFSIDCINGLEDSYIDQ